MAINVFDISKIEVGVQYVEGTASADISSFTYGNAASNLTYYSTSSYGNTAGPAWMKFGIHQGGEFDLGAIALGINSGISGVTGITTFLNGRKTYSAGKQVYFDGTKFNNIELNLNADDNNIKETIQYFPFIDITFKKVSGSGTVGEAAFKEVIYSDFSNRYEESTSNPYTVYGYYLTPSNNTTGNTINVTNSILSANKFICTYDASGNANWYRYGTNSAALTENAFGNIFGIINDFIIGSDNQDYAQNNTFMFGYNQATSYNKNDSFQGMSYVETSGSSITGDIQEIVVRCYVRQHYGTLTIPAASHTESTYTSKTFGIGLSERMNDSESSRTEKHTVTFKLTRNIAQSVDKLNFNVSLDNDVYSYFNEVRLRTSQTATTLFAMPKEISTDPYFNYINRSDEKEAENINPNITYGSSLVSIYEDTYTNASDIYNIYKYYLYLKLSLGDINDIEILKTKLFPTISVAVSNASEFEKDSIHITYYYVPNATDKLSGNKVVLNNSIWKPRAAAATNQIWAYPIGELGVIGNSSHYLNMLYDLDNTSIWKDLISAHTNIAHELTSGQTGYSFLDALDEIYDSSELNTLCNEFVDIIKSNDNLLGTTIPMLINITYTTLAGRKLSIWYLINIIVDFKDVRESLNADVINDFKLLKDSDYLRNGFWRFTKLAGGSDTTLYPFALDYDIDSDIGSKVMSPLDIINRDLYKFNGSTKNINIGESEDLIIPQYLNDYMMYIDMFNISNASNTNIMMKSEHIGDADTGLLKAADDEGFLENENEFKYLYGRKRGLAFFCSIFDDDCPTNSYDLFLDAVKSKSDSETLTLGNKGFGSAAIGYANKDSNIFSVSGDAEPLMTPLCKYEDIFLTHIDANDDKFICINNTTKLSSKIIISES